MSIVIVGIRKGMRWDLVMIIITIQIITLSHISLLPSDSHSPYFSSLISVSIVDNSLVKGCTLALTPS